QGDPRLPLASARKKGVVSYGHRLFCDRKSNRLHFRWGNSIVYRQYYQDYEAFLARPKAVVDAEFSAPEEWAIVYADLSQFYDRVRPDALVGKIRSIFGGKASRTLLNRFQSFFHWK